MDYRSAFSEAFVHYLVTREVVSETMAVQALDLQKEKTPQIGRLALDSGLMSMKQIFHVLREQAGKEIRFGQQAISLGYITGDDLKNLLQSQANARPGIGSILVEVGALDDDSLNDLRDSFLDVSSSALC